MKKNQLPGTGSTKVNLRLLEIFAAVAEEGTMSAAALRLAITQAGVSQAVTLLEEALGVTLFDRSVRPPSLTLRGRSALRCSREILAKVRELEDTMRHGTPGRVPLLRIGMLDSFTSTGGAAMLERLEDVASEWTVVSGFKATSLQALVERRSDAIITSEDRVIPDDVAALPILGEAFMLAVPMRYRGNLNDMRSVAADLDFIRYGRDSHMGAVIDGYLTRAGVHPNPRYQFDTTDAALRMVAAGFGWTIMTPLIFLKSMVPSKTVSVVPLPGKPIRRTLIVAMRRSESDGILQSIRRAALGALRDVVQPQITALLPNVGAQFVIPDDGPVKRARKR